LQLADAVVASWSGHDYQARLFWIKASALRNPAQHYVIEVAYEANGPKSFDDVVVRYDPPRQSATGYPVAADYHQVKFHMNIAGRFGFEDLVKPEFLNAKTISLLQRLQDAKKSAAPNSAFTLVTIDSIKQDDPLIKLISGIDGSLMLDKLFDKTKTDDSIMGAVRKLWKEHLRLSSNDELRTVLEGLRISAGYATLEKLREDVNLSFQVVGLLPCYESAGFKYDAEARALKAQNRNRFDRDAFEKLCQEMNWINQAPSRDYRAVSIRSFPVNPIHDLEAAPEDTLSLLHMFDERHLQPGGDWQTGVQPAIDGFLGKVVRQYPSIRLLLDAHLSIAFLAGARLGLKSGVAVELIQKGRNAHTVWLADDGKNGPAPEIEIHEIGDGKDVALVVSLSRDALEDVRDYALQKLPDVGRLIHVRPQGGPGQTAIAGGQHAAALADAAEAAVRKARVPFGAKTHVFVSGPNSFMFFLGQHQDSMGQCILYEFDFKKRVDGSYHPSFWMK
jgi:hypothetical protein